MAPAAVGRSFQENSTLTGNRIGRFLAASFPYAALTGAVARCRLHTCAIKQRAWMPNSNLKLLSCIPEECPVSDEKLLECCPAFVHAHGARPRTRHVRAQLTSFPCSCYSWFGHPSSLPRSPGHSRSRGVWGDIHRASRALQRDGAALRGFRRHRRHLISTPPPPPPPPPSRSRGGAEVPGAAAPRRESGGVPAPPRREVDAADPGATGTAD